MIDESAVLRAREFEDLVERALPSLLDIESLEREPNLGGRQGPDFLVRLRDGRVALVEAKVVTPATGARVRDVAAQLLKYGSTYEQMVADGRRPVLALATSGVLAPERIQQLAGAGVSEVFDGPAIEAALPHASWPYPSSEDRQKFDTADGRAREFSQRIKQIPPGRSDWPAYQRTIRDILAALWCPPLEQPLSENSNSTGVNRRDVIFPNYSNDGIWKFLRDHYEAHYIVVDAKNYRKPIKKEEVLQIANYLGSHGAGLFGVIVCRSGVSDSADVTRREQWIIHQKLLVFLADEDIDQMVSFASVGTDPAIVVRQKIEDFRLGI